MQGKDDASKPYTNNNCKIENIPLLMIKKLNTNNTYTDHILWRYDGCLYSFFISGDPNNNNFDKVGNCTRKFVRPLHCRKIKHEVLGELAYIINC